jgi:hypothetical protein
LLTPKNGVEITADLARVSPWPLSPKVTSAGDLPGLVRNTPGRFL